MHWVGLRFVIFGHNNMLLEQDTVTRLCICSGLIGYVILPDLFKLVIVAKLWKLKAREPKMPVGAQNKKDSRTNWTYRKQAQYTISF